VLLTYAHRGGALLFPVAALNAVMLVSIPSEGGHYLIDVLAGVATAVFAIVAIRGAQLDRVNAMRPARA
jgi:membrane-associated phospholipid phosphatase